MMSVTGGGVSLIMVHGEPLTSFRSSHTDCGCLWVLFLSLFLSKVLGQTEFGFSPNDWPLFVV